MKEISIEETLVAGSGDFCTTDLLEVDKPLVVRGIVKKDHINQCRNHQRDFYYIDTGYVGNFPSKGNPSGKKIWHRVVKNNLQHHEIRDMPSDRWDALLKQDIRLNWSGWKNYNKKILLVLPNPKSTKFYDIDYDSWVAETIDKIKTFSNLPIEIREKGSRNERNHGYSIYEAFNSGVYATVAFNSIAALESVIYGIPAFVSVPCAATPLASTDLSQLANPYKPQKDQILKQCHNLAYGQFTVEEIESGFAWKILQELA